MREVKSIIITKEEEEALKIANDMFQNCSKDLGSPENFVDFMFKIANGFTDYYGMEIRVKED